MPTGMLGEPVLKVVDGGDRLVAQGDDQVLFGHAGLGGRASGLEADDLDAALLVQSRIDGRAAGPRARRGRADPGSRGPRVRAA